MIFVLIILPLATSSYCICCHQVCSFGRARIQDSSTKVAEGITKQPARADSRVMIVYTKAFPVLVALPIVLILAGQAISGAAFGYAWAAGVVGIETVTDDTTGVTSPAFNPTVLVDQIYDQTMATVSVTLVLGLITGAIIARYLLTGVSAFAAKVFLVWVALCFLFLVPLVYYAGVHDVFSPGKSNEHCKTFPSSYKFSKGACIARFWTFLACLCLILFLVVGMILYGFYNNCKRFFKVPKFLTVRPRLPFPRLTGPLSEARVDVIPAKASASNGFDLSGYRSIQQPFFNFHTKLGQSEETKALLLQPARVSFKFP
jgi:hypothetical protein